LSLLEDRSVPSFGWAAAVGGAGNAVATDSVGDAYVAGSFSGSFTPAGSSVPLTSAGGTDAFVAKYARSGAFQWAVSLGGAGDDAAKGIAVDGAGNVFVVGEYFGTATFGPTTLTSPGGEDAFAAKLGPAGTVQWARNGLTVTGKKHGASNSNVGIAADAAGNAYVADYVVPAAGGLGNVVILKLDGGTGATQWATELPRTFNKKGQLVGFSESPQLTVAGGHVYVTGSFTGTQDFDPGPGTFTLNAATRSGTGGFVLKLTTAGSFVWAQAFQSAASGSHVYPASGIAVDSSGNVYATGSFEGSVDFDPAPNGRNGQGQLVLAGATYPYRSGYIVKLNASGSLVWAKKVGSYDRSVGGPYSLSVAVDAVGAVYLTGPFAGTQDFDPGAGIFNLTSAGVNDIFVLKLDTTGAFQWAVRAGASGNDAGSGIAVNSFGEIYVTGRIGSGTTDFDPTNTYLDDRDLVTTATGGGFLWQLKQP
jgi:hypothetical protein